MILEGENIGESGQIVFRPIQGEKKPKERGGELDERTDDSVSSN
jgi:hypothetical protein